MRVLKGHNNMLSVMHELKERQVATWDATDTDSLSLQVHS